MEILARNVNDALKQALLALEAHGVRETSRNGEVLVFPEPVTITYTRPTERVLFSPMRDANPWLHLMESLGFLAANPDLEWYAYFSKNIRNYSDNGKTLWGNYGVRWREWFDYDQLPLIVKE